MKRPGVCLPVCQVLGLSDFLSANQCPRPGRLQGRGVLPESGVWEHVAVTQPSGRFLLQEDKRYSERKIALGMFFLSLPLLSLSLISTKEDMMESPPAQAPSPKGMSDLPRVGPPREPLARLPTAPASSGQEGALLFSSWGSSTGVPWSGRKKPHSHLTLCLSSLLIFCSVLGMPFRES